jgi:Uma2 family endonuclease
MVEDPDMSTSTHEAPPQAETQVPATTQAPESRPAPAPAPVHRRKKWTNEEFGRLVVEGFLREGSSTYLWDGDIIEPIPENSDHLNALENLRETLGSRLPRKDWSINQDHPIVLGEGFLPEPDLAVLKGPRASYRKRIPSPADVALLAEVSDSSYRDDGGDYLKKYAAVGIPQYWIVHIAARRIEVYTDPFTADDGTSGYRERRDFSLSDRVPLILDGGEGPVEFESIPVLDVLCDSIEPAAEEDAEGGQA